MCRTNSKALMSRGTVIAGSEASLMCCCHRATWRRASLTPCSAPTTAPAAWCHAWVWTSTCATAASGAKWRVTSAASSSPDTPWRSVQQQRDDVIRRRLDDVCDQAARLLVNGVQCDAVAGAVDILETNITKKLVVSALEAFDRWLQCFVLSETAVGLSGTRWTPIPAPSNWCCFPCPKFHFKQRLLEHHSYLRHGAKM